MKIFALFNPFLKKYKRSFYIFVLLSIIVTVLKLFSPLLSGIFIDRLISNPSKNIVFEFSIIYVCIAILQIIISYITSLINVKLRTKISYSLNKHVLNHLQKIPILLLEKKNITYFNQRINSDCNYTVSFCLSILIGVIINVFTLIISITVVIRVDIWMAILIFSLIIAYIILYNLTKSTLKKIIYDLKENNAKYFSSLQEQLSQIRFIKIYNFFSFFKKRLNINFDKFMDSCIKNQKFTFLFQSSDVVISVIAQVILFVFGGLKIIEGELTVGIFSILSSYFTSIISSIKYFITLGNQYVEAMVAVERIYEILNMKEEMNGNLILDQINSIKLQKVNFSYDNKKIIKEFSYDFEIGNIYLINGENGKGKSTLVNLILGLYDNYEGQIFYNKVNIKEIDLYSTRKNFSYISQYDLLLNDSILTNVFLDNEISEHEQTLMKYINLFSINSLSKYSFSDLGKIYINEKNTNFSGGEIKKIMLLRGLLLNRSILILDEPTNSLDSKSIKILYDILKKLKKDHIIIIITHNDSLKLISDKIVNL